MTTAARLITGVDFVALPTHDLERAVEFYGTTLGLERSIYRSEQNFAEFETGNLTLSVIDAEAMGLEHHVQRLHIALHVDDVPAVRTRAPGARCRLSGRHARHRRLSHGLLRGPRWQCTDAAPSLRATNHGNVG